MVKVQKTGKQYIGLSSSYKQSLSSLQKALHVVWSMQQIFLSLTTDTQLSLNINRDLMKDEDKILHNNSLKNTFRKLHSFIHRFHFVYILLVKKQFICK